MKSYLIAFVLVVLAVVVGYYFRDATSGEERGNEFGPMHEVSSDEAGSPQSVDSEVESLAKPAGSTAAAAIKSGVGYEIDEFRLIQEAAERGSPPAQRSLALAVSRCHSVNLNPEGYVQGVRVLAEFPAAKEGAEAVRQAERLVEECGERFGSDPLTYEAITIWLNEAARGGDNHARVLLAKFDPRPLDESRFNQMLDSALDSGEVDVLFELGGVLNRVEGSSGLQWARPDEQISARAWEIAACRLGASQCSANSPQMVDICVGLLRCGYASYEAFVRNEMLTPAQNAALESRVGELIQHFSRG